MAEQAKDLPAGKDEPYYGARVLTKQEVESLRKKRKEDGEASRAWFRAHGVKLLRRTKTEDPPETLPPKTE